MRILSLVFIYREERIRPITDWHGEKELREKKLIVPRFTSDAQKGIGYQTCVKMLLHEASRREAISG